MVPIRKTILSGDSGVLVVNHYFEGYFIIYLSIRNAV